MQPKPRLFSGMQPTGELHLGNYLGALKQWVELARSGQYDCIFCIVDAHAITVEHEPKELPKRILDAATLYIAAGIDPSQTTLFVQSDVPQHTELAWYLSSVTPMGDLGRMTQFKEKAENRPHVSASLFTYPVLMAADILLYKAQVVPVGEDQIQHLELAREICRKFNARYGDIFPEPQPRLSTTRRLMGLDGQAKMSKSRGNTISLLETPEEMWAKLRPAFTDPQRQRRADPGRPEVCNIFTMHRAVSPKDVVELVDQNCRGAAWGCADCKKVLHEHLVKELAPIRERALELQQKPEQVIEVLRAGADRCRKLAEETLTEVRDALGLGARLPS